MLASDYSQTRPNTTLIYVTAAKLGLLPLLYEGKAVCIAATGVVTTRLAPLALRLWNGTFLSSVGKYSHDSKMLSSHALGVC